MAPHAATETKAMVVALNWLGFSNRGIANKLGNVSCTTVGRIVRNYKQGIPLDKEAPRSGRPNKLTLQDIRYAALILARSKAPTVTVLQRTHFPSVSASTLRQYLRKHGMRSYRRRRVPLLVQKIRKARRAWVCACLSWTQAQWDDIVFSDEVRIELFGPDGTRYYWRFPQQSPYDPRFTKKIVSHGGGGIFVWGCIMREGVGRLYRIEGRLTAVKYIEILRDAFLGTLADFRLTPFDITFQHNRDPKHTARVTQRWLLANQVDVLP
jgi:transposase